jgi:hypothetical protein
MVGIKKIKIVDPMSLRLGEVEMRDHAGHFKDANFP